MEWNVHESINTFSLPSCKNTLFNFLYRIDHSKNVKQFYKCSRILWEIARLLFLYDDYVTLTITIKTYTDVL